MSEVYLSTAQVAQIMGISRVAVWQKIKKGKIKAQQIGRSYFIASSELKRLGFLDRQAIKQVEENSEDRRHEIEKAVKRVVREYGSTLKKLGEE